MHRLDVALPVAVVAEAAAAARARDVPELVTARHGIPIELPELCRVGEVGKLTPGHRLHLVADAVGGHRPGAGVPQEGEDAAGREHLKEGPSLHRCSSSWTTSRPSMTTPLRRLKGGRRR